MRLAHERCTGCEACRNCCPVDAITMLEDDKGFLYPKILQDKCIECGLCQKVCPINGTSWQKKCKKVYACWVHDQELRLSSTSGGMFTALADFILENGGVVFGAAFNKEFHVEHICMEKKEEIEKARGAKYVQGRTNLAYQKAKKLLDQGRLVMYTGTPCQIEGLYAYLGKEYENLLTVDLICHGVPSPMIFQSYLELIRHQCKDEICSVRFRYKKPSWALYSMKIDFKDRKPYICSHFKDPYLRGVGANLFQRDVCFSCKYASTERVGDLTIADFWRYREYEKESRNDQKGVSLVMINSKKGEEIFEKIRSGLFVKEKDMASAIDGNRGLKTPWPKNPDSEHFFEDFQKGMTWDDLGKKYFPYKRPGPIEICLRFAENYGHKVPLPIIKFLKKFVS